MSELVSEIIGGEVYQYYPLGEYVVRAVGVCGTRPTFKYTRIEITGTISNSRSSLKLRICGVLPFVFS